MTHVLDTNIVIGALNATPSVAEHLADLSDSDVGIPLIVIAELVFGAHRSRRREENLNKIASLRRAFQILPVSDDVVNRYGALRAELQARGIAKSDFDLLIACTALEHSATLVTGDRALLDGSIGGLRTVDWLG